jgi:tetratricopeptide (TPR) repeat protein
MGGGVLERGARAPSATPPAPTQGGPGLSPGRGGRKAHPTASLRGPGLAPGHDKGRIHLRRAWRIAALTVVLVVVGMLAPLLHGPGPERPPAPSVRQDVDAVARPAILSGTLARQVASLQDRLRTVPHDWQSWALLGLAYVQQARITADPRYYPKADGALHRSLSLGPEGNFQAEVGEGALALARHDFTGALRWGQRARRVNPYNANVYGVIGDAQVELGRYRGAFRTFQHMVDFHPELSSYARASYALELQGDVPAALRAMRLAVRAAGTPEDRAFAAYQLGELHFSRGRIGPAVRLYREAAALAPDYAPPHAALAKAAWARGRIDEAIRRYGAVVGRYPLPEYVIALGDLQHVAGRPAAAARSYELVRVEERLFRAAGVNVDLELAMFDADHGRPHAALATARAEWRRRHSILVADALAWSLHRVGHDKAALRYARLAHQLGYRSAQISFHKAMIEITMGDPGAARRDLELALDINRHFSILQAPVAERALSKLERNR